MHEFSFQNPTRIEFGIDKEKNIGRYMKEFGAKKVVIIFGSDRIKQSGLFDDITTSLCENGIEFTQCGKIKSNPVLSKVREGIAIAKQFGADSVLSIGGGSCLDSAKAIAAGSLYDGDVWDFFTGTQVTKALNIFDVMTLAATGSEMNNGGVITNEDTKQKYPIHGFSLFPKVSVINPKLQTTISRDYLVYSAADIIAHSIEGYFTATVQPELINLQIEANIKTVMRTTERLLQNPNDLDARGEFAWAATLALNGLTYVGTAGFSYPNHMIEHAMSAICDVPHGAGLSVVMPAWMTWYHSRNPKQFQRFAEQIFGLSTAEQGIEALRAWFNKIGTPTTLGQLNINEHELKRVIDNAAQNAIDWQMSDVYSRQIIAGIFDLAK
ncbi:MULTISPECIES: iron-containing alcohol dehydrogenase [unclassified Gilliamella]|uniref:iron-containing alcohol dehydrogenase n=1 Tax=unclassified Gilliamella TaxID=2685620 RepID=UPI001306F78A|nr:MULTISPECIES: iron-containing alcohol dehydrogenase [unclassified Gilliamella]MWP48306.1 iron-containing alcohol dehydrogenase [Gilliamella sp. Lep-s35]MWP68226.1 iron-containing alcohol dehydrogenase [Gilliamella sp. Lep-s5]MWP76446.1 iron-containing alcohol dehydrogenase [Gilliamella sp. Lep-s21]